MERFQGVCLCGTLLKLKLQGQNEEQLPHNSISFDYKPFYFNREPTELSSGINCSEGAEKFGENFWRRHRNFWRQNFGEFC